MKFTAIGQNIPGWLSQYTFKATLALSLSDSYN